MGSLISTHQLKACRSAHPIQNREARVLQVSRCSPTAEATDLKSVQYGFESHQRHMIDADKLVKILDRMTLQHAYDTVAVNGVLCKDVWLNITMTQEEYSQFKELFNEH